MMIMIRIEVNS